MELGGKYVRHGGVLLALEHKRRDRKLKAEEHFRKSNLLANTTHAVKIRI